MWLLKNKPLFFCVLIIVISFACTLSAALSVAKPIGADYYFHNNIATFLSKGDVAGAWNYTNFYNTFPYGFYLSVFHFMLVPAVWSGNPYLIAQILQVLFLPVTLALSIWLVYRFGNPKAAVYCGMALFASWAFFDGALQVRPESLDLLFYPLMVAAALSAKRLRFVGLAVVSVYSHGLAALSNIYGLAVKLWHRKFEWRTSIALGFIAVTPVLIVSIFYLGGAFQKWFTFGNAGSLNPQQALFWNDPVGFIPYYMGATMLGVPFLFKRGKSEFESLLVYGIVGSLIMLPFWADRWLHYIALPLAMLTGLGITGLKNQNHKMIFALVLLTFLIVYVASYFAFSFGIFGHWWQPGD